MNRRGGPWSAAWTSAAHSVLARSPLPALAHARAEHRLTVLAYHGVPDAAAFAAQLDWLQSHATPVSLPQVRSALLEGTGLPPQPVLLTFDDGDRSLLEVAAPLLARRRLPGVAFVVAGLIDTDEPFWWAEVERLAATGATSVPGPQLVRHLKQVPDAQRRQAIARMREVTGERMRTPQLTAAELRELERDGIAVANHSFTHPCLDRCDDAQTKTEVYEAHERLSHILGHPPLAFAYPNGNCDARVREAVAAVGYDLAFAFDHRVATLPVLDPLAVSRVRVDAGAPLDRFRVRASGLHPWLHHLRGGT